MSRNNVGNVYEAADDLARAISTLDFAVSEFERVLGSTHPSSLNAGP
ncbi:tetratricopeptide repeat protein [Microbacterium aurum]